MSGPDGIGRINCTVSSETARFAVNGGVLETGGVTQTRNASTTTLVVNTLMLTVFKTGTYTAPILVSTSCISSSPLPVSTTASLLKNNL